jgi:putative membrane protein
MRNLNAMKSVGVVACLSAMLAINPAFAGQTPSPQPPAATPPPMSGQPDMPKGAIKGAMGADAAFVKQAAEGGMIEVAKGRLAAQKGAHEDIKQFGQRMVDDHTKAGDELKAIAGGKNMLLPDETPKAPMQAAMTKLGKLEGAAFDRAWVDDQLRDHDKTIALFEREAKTGADAELKAFAVKTLPVLKEHRTMVQSLKAKLAKGGTD